MAANRVFSELVSNKYLRWTVVRFYTVLGNVSAKLALDPIVELPLGLIGIDSRFALHLFKRDVTALVEVFVNRVYEASCNLLPGDTVVDCGANIGEFTVHAARLVGREGLVVAFEPNPESFSLCKTNILRNKLENVMLFNKALGEREETAFLEIDGANLGGSKIVWKPSRNSSLRVAVRPLTEFLPLVGTRTIKLLKLDVEGSAIDIINGGDEFFEKRLIQNVAAELHPGEEQLRKFLEDREFTCKQVGSYLYAALEPEKQGTGHENSRA